MADVEMMDASEKIDDSLYSRQRYVLGDNAMKKMAHSHVLLVGFGGLGVEIAKNVTLAGVKSLTIQDHRLAQISDLSTQFFLRESDVAAGKTRVEAGVERLSELNPHVIVKAIAAPFGLQDSSWRFLSDFKCVILTEESFDVQLEVDEFCRAQQPPIQLITGDVRGLFAYGFCDFGLNFEVLDSNGEEAKDVFICNITKGEEGVVTVYDARPHGFESGDSVKFKEVNGMIELNDQTREIKVVSPYQFTIGDTTQLSTYTGGGIASELKLPKYLSFNSLNAELKAPSLSFPDLCKFNAPPVIHLAFQAFYICQQFPHSYEQFFKTVTELNSQQTDPTELDETLLKAFYLTSPGCFLPLCTVYGGFLAQEVIKAVSGKFTPLNQWLHMDACEVIDINALTSRKEPFAKRRDRYDDLRLCVGQETCEKLFKLKLFMVGCGAIGCEMMKLYALLGIATDGKLTITDNDCIEKSNLNRQFLFRPHHVEKSKSVTAAESSLNMNPDMVIDAQQHKVHAGTEEEIHTDQFFHEQDIIVNALDNVEARIYMDQRCIDTERPLLESGTTGAKGHTQIIVPYLTESYGSQRDPVDEDVPFCSLKSFPAKLDHCIIWARDKFESSYSEKPRIFNKFWVENSPVEAVKQRLLSGEVPKHAWVVAKMLKQRPITWIDCVRIARLKFESYFCHKAKSLLHAYPLDHLRNDGAPFWQLPRRPPHPIQFDQNSPEHMSFVKSAARLFAESMAVPSSEVNTKPEFLNQVLATIEVPEFTPKSKKIVVDESETAPTADDMDTDEKEICDMLEQVLAKPNSNIYFSEMTSLEFEKDDDSNGHIDYIAATANLRAEMYGIEGSDRYSIKRVAGKIIPAIATTTATVAGLVTMELFKLIRKAPLEHYKNSFLSLALPAMVLSEPGAAKSVTIREGLSFNLWDKVSVQGTETMTLNDFISKVKEVMQLEVDMILQGSRIVYMTSFLTHRKKLKERMSVLVKPQGTKPYIDLTVCYKDLSDELSEGAPTIRYMLPIS
ncbi:ubiquitin-like modifier-activating enzyme 6 [Watersipora subatra]|uniref:ubiquitin-like modifier-activating enzyme 6 n=1 Tax=Watersipora subatra TaxID=2589382 RepID=UPI00355C64A2